MAGMTTRKSKAASDPARMVVCTGGHSSPWFLKSAKAFGHDVKFIIGPAMIRELERLRDVGFTHALYTHSDDVIICATKGRILSAYQKRGSPPVLFSFFDGNPNVGQWMGRIDALITMWSAVNSRYEGTAQGRMIQAWADKVNISLDGDGSIFRQDAATYAYKTWASCLLHFNTGVERMEEICAAVLGDIK